MVLDSTLGVLISSIILKIFEYNAIYNGYDVKNKYIKNIKQI